jgi:signal transduction histidine kinase
VRLTALCALLFLGCGAALIVVNYELLSATAFEPVGAGAVGTGYVSLKRALASQVLPFLLGTPAVEVPRGQLERQLRQQERDRAIRSMLLDSLAGLGAMTAAAVGLGWVVAGRALRPVHEITAAARRASEHNLRERVGLTGPHDELRELADTLDGLLARLEAAFEVQRSFAETASRELRAPLARARRAIEDALAAPDVERYRAMAVEVREAVAAAERLIDGLLTLARSEEAPRSVEPADLADAASDALASTAREAAERGLRVETSLEPAPVEGVRGLLERAVAELVVNGVRHNRPGGLLEIACGVADGAAFLAVESDGPPIAPEAVEALFEPFRRLRGDGAGLGLAIARSVAAHHGGRLEVFARPSGGLTAWLTLPARQ